MRELSDLDVLDLDTGKVHPQDELITIPQAAKLFSVECECCGTQLGMSPAMIYKAARLGHLKKYNKYGSEDRKRTYGNRVYLNYWDVKAFIDKQKRLKGRRQWSNFTS